MKTSRLIEHGVTWALIGHLGITVFQNTPDAHISMLHRFTFGWTIPQWRFFAPNPGTENVHILYRQQDNGTWSPWTELPTRYRPTWHSGIWNPGNRGYKALFDAAQQLMTLSGHGATFDWVAQSPAYKLLADVIAERLRSTTAAGTYQFMLATSTPEAGPEGVKPILTSFPTAL